MSFKNSRVKISVPASGMKYCHQFDVRANLEGLKSYSFYNVRVKIGDCTLIQSIIDYGQLKGDKPYEIQSNDKAPVRLSRHFWRHAAIQGEL